MFSRTATAILFTAALVAGQTPALADNHELCGVDLTNAVSDAAITADITSVSFIAGVRWGTGELVLKNGERHKFKIIGGKVLETGVVENVITGEVYNLKNVEDFEGTYYGAATGIVLATGEGESIANNSNCVVIKARAVGHGLQLSAPAPSGVEITFID